MTALVIGYGSIGSRHAAILSRLGLIVTVVTAQKIQNFTCFPTLEEALEKNHFDEIIIANPTHLHYSSLRKIQEAKFQGTVLVEKPLFSQIELEDIKLRDNIYVAYNLRFHPLFQQVRNFLQWDEIVSFSVQAGSYLPDWRKNTDYRDCYSAKKECGGGVLRDLSHELDYILWLCGKCVDVTAMGGHFSSLEINSDDVNFILMRCENCPVVSVQLDYLNRVPTRKILIQTKKQNTIFLDLIRGDLIFNGEVKFQEKDAIPKTYVRQHELIMKKDFSDICNYTQGLEVMKLIAAIEQASNEKRWVVL